MWWKFSRRNSYIKETKKSGSKKAPTRGTALHEFARMTEKLNRRLDDHLALPNSRSGATIAESTNERVEIMTRRNFLKTSGAGAFALATANTSLFAAQDDKPLRVGLIGCGWYGKTDLFHLIQVAPVEVVGL